MEGGLEDGLRRPLLPMRTHSSELLRVVYLGLAFCVVFMPFSGIRQVFICFHGFFLIS
jgi:hypothetical protein